MARPQLMRFLAVAAAASAAIYVWFAVAKV
jgi:hypothetical protein